jgi:hypothetical protein
MRKEQARISQRWRYIMLDLAALGPLKERLATFHLLERSSRMIPELRQTIKKARVDWKLSDERMAEIVRRCGRNVETNEMIIPPRYAQPYADELKLRKDTTRLLKKSSTLLKAIVIRLTRRLKDTRLLGRAASPSMRVLPPFMESTVALPLSDDDLGQRIVALETLLKAPLGGPRPVPNAAAEPPEMIAGPESLATNAGDEMAATEVAEAPLDDFAFAQDQSGAEYQEGEADVSDDLVVFDDQATQEEPG